VIGDWGFKLLTEIKFVPHQFEKRYINKDGIGQLLLFNLSILEYNGASRWNYINPVLKLSTLFQEALTNEQQKSGNT
jgi:hypothetical protein